MIRAAGNCAVHQMGRCLLRGIGGALSAEHREWGDALLAELTAIDGVGTRLRFALSGAWGMSVVLVKDALAGHVADPGTMLLALSIGVVATGLDLRASSRTPGVALISLACIAFGALSTRAVWRWPLVVGGMLPMIMAVTGHTGAYEFDRADRWYGVLLATASTALGLAGRVAVLATRRAMRGMCSR